ncbi:MAG TPA: bifunctional isocitrate dehydrogenase kinase/phosphatase [Pseudomonadales bacterium]
MSSAANDTNAWVDPVEAHDIATLIRESFRVYRDHFRRITLAAKSRFERADWIAGQRASAQRIEIYKVYVTQLETAIRARLGANAPSPTLSRAVKGVYAKMIGDLPDYELAETYFNSIHRRISADKRVDETQSFIWSEFDEPPLRPSEPIFRAYSMQHDIVATFAQVLRDLEFELPWQNLERDVANILRSLPEARPEIRQSAGLDVEILKSVFYRNKGAYLVGCLRYFGSVWPLVLPILVDDDRKLYVDTMICDEDELSVVFSYTRSYFMVDAPYPFALVDYLSALLPGKKRSEIYTSIGMHKHGKTEFYRGFLTHLARSKDQFVIAPGIKGMVMTVFTLPSYQTVFKIIKDRFAPQKDITRAQVKQKYSTVKTHDRVGRMADTQEFVRFALPRARFAPELIDELTAVAASSITLTDDLVILEHVYTERLMLPLNLYIEDATTEQLREVLDEYGNAIKQLAAANIFPGDMLLKNFGVTRHGRVVFYDYDEICYLTDVNFRALPAPHNQDEEFSAEPWFSVGTQDVFPEEFRRFLFGRPEIKRMFTEMHGELFDPGYWQGLQRAIRAGEVMDVFPYRRKKRFARNPVPRQRDASLTSGR